MRVGDGNLEKLVGFKELQILPENQISPRYRYIENTPKMPKVQICKNITTSGCRSILPIWSGSAGESHPHAPTDPCVNLSIHTAPASLPLETSRSQIYAIRTRLLPRFSGVDLRLLQAGSSPSLQSHYGTFNTTTG